MITTNLRVNSNSGKGVWRANPFLSNSDDFRKALTQELDSLSTSRTTTSLSPQVQWDSLKQKIKQLSHHHPINSTQIKVIEGEIANIQQTYMDNLALRASIQWLEDGEKSAGLLKRITSARMNERSIPPLQHPETQEIGSSLTHLYNSVCSFYGTLYSPTPISSAAVDDLLEHFPPIGRFSQEVLDTLVAPITIDELNVQVARCLKKSRPGLDGLPYQILELIFKHEGTQELIKQTYNNALDNAIFPESWSQTCLCLLPKKGDLSLLKNWRPIALTNVDCKIFTRIINSRMISLADVIINRYQTGFVHGRYIADNGMLVRLIMDHAHRTNRSDIALLLDGDKAYDWLHPDYLHRVLLHYGFPSSLVSCIMGLFFGSQIKINVNGHLSPPISQQRGVRQGDPLSPLLFNFTIEPLLQRILHDQDFIGYGISSSFPDKEGPAPAKLLSYADDTLVFLNNSHDLQLCLQHLDTYAAASNTKINFEKTHAIFLSGNSSATWIQELAAHDIHSWHNHNSTSALVYLGYPLY
ncbi:hypothetical protein INT45_006540 [Circinella minor]|uniref:Reverse transcriptase domain-containing protein n=1 Tax=Circinella minor TaxID=1195481 RepID=A0A8H7RDM1_9FUNG|nr:hypothetical protein INT45_006540 [Circinella minor]